MFHWVLCLPVLLGCPTIREGHFACGVDEDCPAGWFCRAERCYSRDDVDATVADAGLDAADADADAREDGAFPVDAPRDVLEPTDGLVEDAGCTPIADKVDLLLVVDNSNSMLEEQAALIASFPDLVLGLTTGSFGDRPAMFPPVTDIHVGVVTTDMGTAGIPIPTCEPSMFGDDGRLLETYRGRNSQCPTEFSVFAAWDTLGNIFEFRDDFQCRADVGTAGCGLEQQLEAMLKATTPSTLPTQFFDGAPGHADGPHADFFRSDAVLVVLIITDESDCSVADPTFYSDDTLGGLNTRCAMATELLHPVSRYSGGLLQGRDRDRVVFGALIGMPQDLESSTPEAILADPRMTLMVDQSLMPPIVSACSSMVGGTADPGRRFVEVARDLDAVSGRYALGSICNPDYTPFFERLYAEIAPSLESGCDS